VNILAMIPARGGSKGIPGKNIIDLSGKPLIAYTIQQALKGSEFGRVQVSTENEGIKRIAINPGLTPFVSEVENEIYGIYKKHNLTFKKNENLINNYKEIKKLFACFKYH